MGFTEDFLGIKFPELSLTKELIFPKAPSLRFRGTLVYGFENNLIKNQYFLLINTNDKIADGLEKT